MFELTPDNAADFLRSRGYVAGRTIRVEPLGWGVSNAVFRVITPDRMLVLKQSRPRLRTRDAWFSDINRVFREAEVMRRLWPLLPAGSVPQVLFEDRENYFFGMSLAPEGSRVWKEMLLEGNTSVAIARFAGLLLGMIHERTSDVRSPWSVVRSEEATDYGLRTTDLSDPTVFVQLRIDPFYQRIRERRPEVAHEVELLIEQMLSIKEALCHGDFSPKNFLVRPWSVVRSPWQRQTDHGLRTTDYGQPSLTLFTLVDYETAHIGDPAMDVGFFLSHLLLKAIKNHEVRHLYYALTEAFWSGYELVVRFKPVAELAARGIQHLGVCILARIDGTSPVDYLPEEPKREVARNLGRVLLREKPTSWSDVPPLLDRALASLR